METKTDLSLLKTGRGDISKNLIKSLKSVIVQDEDSWKKRDFKVMCTESWCEVGDEGGSSIKQKLYYEVCKFLKKNLEEVLVETVTFVRSEHMCRKSKMYEKDGWTKLVLT